MIDTRRYIGELTDTLDRLPFDDLNRIVGELLACRDRGGIIFLAGNGGSSATASHFACDLAKGTQVPDCPPFRVIALTDNIPLMTAWGNDVGYEEIFAAQLTPLLEKDDLLLIISASGNSANVLRAVEEARDGGAVTIALTGGDGGAVARLADHVVRVPGQSIEQIEDGHSAICHALCVTLRECLRTEAR